MNSLPFSPHPPKPPAIISTGGLKSNNQSLTRSRNPISNSQSSLFNQNSRGSNAPILNYQSPITNHRSSILNRLHRRRRIERILACPADRPLPGSAGGRLRCHPQWRWAVYGRVTICSSALLTRVSVDENSETGLPPALAQALHGQNSTPTSINPARPDAQRGPEPGARNTGPGPGNMPKSRPARSRSRLCRRTMPQYAWPPVAISPRFSATLPIRATSSSATRVRTGPPSLHQPGQVRPAFSRRLRRHRHRQILPDPHRAGRADVLR